MNGKNGIASMLQVCANSTMERDYLYNDTNSLSAFFKAEYKQHSYFDKEPLTTDSIFVSFDSSVLFELDKRRSEMVGNLVVQLETPALSDEYVWVNDLGPALIDYVSIINGDRELVHYTGLDLLTHHTLNTSASRQKGMHHMLGHYNTRYSLNGTPRTLYVPIPFMREQFFPIFIGETFQVRVALKAANEVMVLKNESVQVLLGVVNGQVRVRLNTNENDSNVTVVKVRLLYDAIHLSPSERYLYSSRQGELLFYSMQRRTYKFFVHENVLTCLLDFTGTASHLIVTATNGELKKLDTFTLIINGVIIGMPDTSTDVYRYFNHSLCTKRYVYVIPFALDCHQAQPSGALTFFGRKNTVLVVKREDTSYTCDVGITAVLLDRIQFKNGSIV